MQNLGPASGWGWADLKGAGEVVTVADSGLDVQHAFFRDDVSVDLRQVIEGHRKVVCYDADKVGDDDGHGTHVAGTVAGAVIGSSKLARWEGIAPEARLHIVFNEEFILDFPVAEALASVGSYISTNSWSARGGPENAPLDGNFR